MIMIKSWMDCRQDISEDLQTFYLGRKFSTGVNTQNRAQRKCYDDTAMTMTI
jgi:hypothetical protein